MVERRWATATVVLVFIKWVSASCTNRSLSVSKADVEIVGVDDLSVVYGVNNTIVVSGKVNTTEFGVA